MDAGVVELVAHRAGNEPHLIAPAIAVADTVELDVHSLRMQLEVRHSKAVWPFRFYWERGQGRLPNEHPHELAAVLASTPPDAHLWIDLKGFTGWFARRVLRNLGGRRPLTMSSRSWWALRPAVRADGVRSFRSVGNRAQLWVATRLRHPDGIVMHERFATAEVIECLRHRCSNIAVWAVDDRARADELCALGVDAMILDDLDLIASLRAERGGGGCPAN